VTSVVNKQWQARNPDYVSATRGAFAGQPAMALVKATLENVRPGYVEIHLPIHDMIMSHVPGIVHGGTLGMVADSAMGFAAFTLAEVGQVGVTAEYKINMLAPAMGQKIVAHGAVVKPGKNLTVARADLYAINGESEKLVATALATLVAL
jgi:uncharacterized protein (TIGR00369 family)